MLLLVINEMSAHHFPIMSAVIYSMEETTGIKWSICFKLTNRFPMVFGQLLNTTPYNSTLPSGTLSNRWVLGAFVSELTEKGLMPKA